jgi:diadenosine tetraphosphate (Ap4A) HIT family hydrolase
MDFVLHSRLTDDTVFVTDWDLSRVLLMNDKRFPWIVLVPRRACVSEIFDLDENARVSLIGEINRAAKGLKSLTQTRGGCDKINIGSLGNLVPQLHVHIIARSRSDPAWPGPVWGAGEASPYESAALLGAISELRDAL